MHDVLHNICPLCQKACHTATSLECPALSALFHNIDLLLCYVTSICSDLRLVELCCHGCIHLFGSSECWQNLQDSVFSVNNMTRRGG